MGFSEVLIDMMIFRKLATLILTVYFDSHVYMLGLWMMNDAWGKNMISGNIWYSM